MTGYTGPTHASYACIVFDVFGPVCGETLLHLHDERWPVQYASLLDGGSHMCLSPCVGCAVPTRASVPLAHHPPPHMTASPDDTVWARSMDLGRHAARGESAQSVSSFG
eukprot:CAMPEP_0181205170 /NCGR_PEP_ID=MMETSP1096-20121128/20324_1 /TAXON_ID=156174 ORGANISM="Chrysochromulina ericina, Strain CCMP281" /NCGR_SAMPLE_ID=MMETSP1096 /ASSEMBLY_ACC=CAM_ASM_000453 /LENGTH=108 /DNA_ID=CAMNT_0023295915 /DNA_START=400 /DNA_END=726 /DNA_ORIENTATION=-